MRGAQSVYGVYRCQAENNHGEQFINIELQEARKCNNYVFIIMNLYYLTNLFGNTI